jgi:hypothetical protein
MRNAQQSEDVLTQQHNNIYSQQIWDHTTKKHLLPG